MAEAAGWFYLLLGSLAFCLALILAIGSETAILRWLNYGSPRRSLIVALVMNIVSTLFGFFTPLLVGDLVVWPAEATGLGYIWARGIINWGATIILLGVPDYRLKLILRLIVSLVTSIVIEGLVLLGFRQTHSTLTIWRMSLVANGVSYSLLMVLYILMVGLTNLLFR